MIIDSFIDSDLQADLQVDLQIDSKQQGFGLAKNDGVELNSSALRNFGTFVQAICTRYSYL